VLGNDNLAMTVVCLPGVFGGVRPPLWALAEIKSVTFWIEPTTS
jgi:hypothetical protein